MQAESILISDQDNTTFAPSDCTIQSCRSVFTVVQDLLRMDFYLARLSCRDSLSHRVITRYNRTDGITQWDKLASPGSIMQEAVGSFAENAYDFVCRRCCDLQLCYMIQSDGTKFNGYFYCSKRGRITEILNDGTSSLFDWLTWDNRRL